MKIKYVITIVKKSPNGYQARAFVTNFPETASEYEMLLDDDEVMFVNEVEADK